MSNRNAGDVTLRFSVENAEVVRQALGALGKDGEKALRQFDASAKPIPRTFAVLSEAMAQARLQGQAWASSLGPVGATLTAIGPAGLVAGAAIGGVLLAMKAGIDWVNRFADEMVRLRNTAQSLDLSTTQLQALNDAGAAFAVTEEKMQTALQRFVAQLDEFKRAEGPLFDFLNRTNPVLARQMLAAQGTAQAIDLLAQAYQKLSAQQQAALSKTAFGRTGFDVGLVMQSLPGKGGMAGIEAEIRKSGDLIEESLIKRVEKLRNEIKDMASDANNNFASVFSEELLEKQKRFVEAFLELSRIAKSFELSSDAKSYLSTLARVSIATVPGGGLIAGIMGGVNYLAERGRARGGEQVALGGGGTDIVPQASGSAEVSAEKGKISAVALYNIEKKRLELLGSAMTPMEAYRLKQLEIAAANEGAGVSTDVANRALVALALSQGQAAVAARQRLGLLTEEEALQQGLRQLQSDRANGYIRTDEEMAAAEKVLRKEIQDSHDAMKVRIAEYPQLTRAVIDAADRAKQLDGQIVRGVDTIADGLADAAMGTKTLSQAFSEMASSILRDIIRIQARNLLLSAAGGLMGIGTPRAAADGAYFSQGRSYFADGGIFTNRIVNRRTPFAFAQGGMFGLGIMGEKNEEAIIPLRRARGGRLGVDASGIGGGTNVQIAVINQTGTPVQARMRRAPSRGGERIEVMLKQAVREVMHEDLAGNGEISRRIADRFGLDPTRGM